MILYETFNHFLELNRRSKKSLDSSGKKSGLFSGLLMRIPSQNSWTTELVDGRKLRTDVGLLRPLWKTLLILNHSGPLLKIFNNEQVLRYLLLFYINTNFIPANKCFWKTTAALTLVSNHRCCKYFVCPIDTFLKRGGCGAVDIFLRNETSFLCPLV